MKMKRYFFISEDLDDLERLEEELERQGIVTPQIHVLTTDDSAADQHHHLHQVVSFMKKDIIHSTLIGAAIGACAAILVLAVAYTAGWTDTPAGWVPFVFLAVVLLGFFTWEGGFLGIQKPNVHFRNFHQALKDGKHVFFVDLEPRQEDILQRAAQKHPSLKPAGTAAGTPHWIVSWQYHIRRFFVHTFP